MITESGVVVGTYTRINDCPCHGWQEKHLRRTHSLTPPDTGANASAEEAEEALDDADVKVNNIINSFRLQPTSFDKKGYLVYLKGKLPRAPRVTHHGTSRR